MNFFGFGKKKENRSIETDHVQDSACSIGYALSNFFSGLGNTNALSLAPFFAAVNIISNSCAIMDWFPCTQDGEALKQTHYLHHLFDKARVNRFLTVKNMIKDVLLTGNGYAYIIRDNETGKPITLRYLPAGSVNAFVNNFTDEIYYQSEKVQKGYITEMDMIHFKIHSRDGLIGQGIPQLAHLTVDLAGSTEKATSNYMASGGAVYGIITPNETRPDVPTTQKQLDNIRQSWEEAKAKSGTSTIILPTDVKFTQLSANSRDAALIETRLYNLQEIARWFSISPILLGDLSHSQYGNMEEAQQELVQHTLQPFVIMMEEELNKKLIMPSKICSERIDVNENAILATNKTTQAQWLTTLVEKGIITVNESRDELDYPRVDGGDQLRVYYSDTQQNDIANEDEGQQD